MKQMIVNAMMFIREWALVVWAWAAVALFFGVVVVDFYV